MTVTKQQAIAFRWERGGLNRLRPPGEWKEHLRNLIPDSPPGMAALSLAARTEGEAPFARMLEEAWERREIEYVMGIRLMHCFILPELFSAATLAMQPPDGNFSGYYQFIAKHFRERGFDMRDIYPTVLDCMLEALADGPMRVNDLSIVLNGLAPPPLRNLDDGPYSFSQYLMQTAFLSGCFELLPRIGGKRVIGLRETAAPRKPADEDRRAIARLYLAHYGPSNLKDFAAWLTGTGSIGNRESSAALRAWELIEEETAEVHCEGKAMRVLAQDLNALSDPPPPTGVRLLPTRDPYIGQRPYEWLAPEEGVRKLIWSVVMPPGTLHWDGRLAGIWKLRKMGKYGDMIIDTFDPLVTHARKEEIEMWAGRIATARGVNLGKLTMN